jgi:osmotically-inducible protein OsmY
VALFDDGITVHDGSMTITERPSDGALKAAVAEELKWMPSINSANIHVSVEYGLVTLSGEVDNYPDKFLAEKAALRVHGVSGVFGEIQVRENWSVLSDSEIAAEASAALDKAIDIPPGSVQVAVHDHVVTLSGAVNWHFQRQSAERAVRYLKGVTDLRNTVTIKPQLSAAGLKTKITTALVRNAQLEEKGIAVTADDSVVTLTGKVRTCAERHQADMTAWSAPGVTSVTNQLVVAA